MKTILTLTILIIHLQLLAQYNYGLDICNQDARIEGKLDIQSGGNSVIIGHNAGLNDNGDNNTNVYIGESAGMDGPFSKSNTFIGYQSGKSNFSFGNSFLGFNSGFRLTSGWENVLIGFNSGLFLQSGKNNVYVGVRTGISNTTGSNNIFIGDSAGGSETGSNRLYIESAPSSDPDYSNPLIYGEFDNNKLQVNGSFHITEFAKLEPQISPPSNPDKGTVYYDSGDDKVKVWTGMVWENLN